MQRILITGVTGFIGSNLVEFFAKQDTFFIAGHSRDMARAGIAFGDTQVQLVEECSAKTLDENRIDTVIHLAGIAHDLSNKYKPEDYDLVNFENTKTIFDEFIKSKAKKFIFLSSIKAAVDTSSVPVTETIAPTPVTSYGKSKQKAEEYIQSVQLDPEKAAYIFRPCMIHGPGNKGNLNFLYRYAKTGMPFPFGSFDNQRSFLSIDNFNFIVQSFIEKDIPSGIFHLADDGDISTKELYLLIAKELGKTPRAWSLPVGMIRLLFSVGGKRSLLDKLTEDMLVSNKKILHYIQSPLPVEMREGLKKTIRSFNGR